MNKTYTLKELADIGARSANATVEGSMMSLLYDSKHQTAREEFTKAILAAIGYEFPKDEEMDAFAKWWEASNLQTFCNADDAFKAWKAGREELRRSQSLDKRPTEPVEPAWIPWSGGECPLPDGVKRWEFRYRDGFISANPMMPSKYHWRHEGSKHDIIAYRVWE